ncbi:outer membrane beta-barrel family protein [Pontibacter chitinilyticus]|uniref:outer membrane beta-barrel family protein n=1 Tax=Pontibacter chitinilyticus TaxID=2674989 RepID=UPI00321A0908
MKMYRLLLLVLLISLGASANAQTTADMLTGSVKDAQDQPLGFVNVAVLDASSAAVVTGTIADMDGHFLIKSPAKGTYLLKLTFLGYAPLQTTPFEVSGENFGKDFGALIMNEDAQQLQEVTVQAMRPMVVTEAGKTVVSVEGTALAGGSTAFEVLTKSPGVWLDQEGNIKLNGKGGVQVMLDGKSAYLSGKELQNLLQSMPAENIKNLEIISNPSAKYDAEGSSGIININLKKNELSGMNGSVHGGYQYSKLQGYTAGAELNYKQGNWNTFGSLDMAERTHYRTNLMQRQFAESSSGNLVQDIYEEGTRFVPTLRLGTDYELNIRHSIGATATLSDYQTNDMISSETYLRSNQRANDLFVQASNTSEAKYKNGTFNIHYLGKLDTVGTTLSADLDYVRLSSQDNARFINHYDSLQNDAPVYMDRLTTQNPTGYDIYAAKTDFARAIGRAGKLELGAKASRVVSDNEVGFYVQANEQQQLDQSRSNHFIYKENIYAAYANYATKLGKQWSLQAGLRAEQTVSEGHSVTLDQTTERSYLNLFPSLFVQQKVSDKYQISYSFSRRINRPRYEALNPFVFYLDPYTAAIGNTQLKPQFTNALEVTQVLHETYNLTLGYAVTKDFIFEVPVQDETKKMTLFQQQNVDDAKSLYATLVAPLNVMPKWQMNNTATVSYQQYTEAMNGNTLENDQVTFMAQSNQQVQLPKAIRMELNAAYQGPVVYGLYRIKSSWGMDAGLKRSFMEDKLDVSLSVTDIFRTRRMRGDTEFNGTYITSRQYTGAQSFKVNLRYRFNKGTQFEAKKRDVSLDELNRAGGK